MDLDTPCKIWTGALEKTGYGRRKVKGKMWMAHRFAYQEHYGDLDPELVVDHICFNRACVEPTHLRQITVAENSARHYPDCPCQGCNPGVMRVTICKAGHDISRLENRTTPDKGSNLGGCIECSRRRKREYMRRHRAGLAAEAA